MSGRAEDGGRGVASRLWRQAEDGPVGHEYPGGDDGQDAGEEPKPGEIAPFDEGRAGRRGGGRLGGVGRGDAKGTADPDGRQDAHSALVGECPRRPV